MHRQRLRLSAIGLMAAAIFVSCSGGADQQTLSGTVEVVDFELTWQIRSTAHDTDPEYRGAIERCVELDDDDCSGPIIAEQDEKAIGTSCSAGIPGPYSDISTGAEVVLRNESGSIVALGQLGAGVIEVSGVDQHPHSCVFSFTLDEVPQASFYVLEVGSHDGPRYSFQQLVDQNWTVDLTVGPWS